MINILTENKVFFHSHLSATIQRTTKNIISRPISNGSEREQTESARYRRTEVSLSVSISRSRLNQNIPPLRSAPGPQSLYMYAKHEIASESARSVFLPPLTHSFLPFPSSPLLFFSFFFSLYSLPRNATVPLLGQRETPPGVRSQGGWTVLWPGWACANVLRPRYHATTTSKIEIPFPLILHGIELCGGNAGLAMGFHCNCARLRAG